MKTLNFMPDLSEIIRGQIAAGSGRISFEQFMDMALYYPDHGYYVSMPRIPGRRGDFFTNVSVGALYGELMARQMAQIWEIMGRPQQFAIVEQGAMDGQLAADVMGWAKKSRPDFFEAIDYRIVEPFWDNRLRQTAKLESTGFTSRTHWVGDWSECEENSISGVVFSNELLDSFPVRRIAYRAGQWMESFVTWSENVGDIGAGRFVFIEESIIDAALKERIARLPLPPLEGYTTEINMRAGAWVHTVASRLRRGVVLTVDYGFPRELYYAPERSEGTLQCYRAHQSGNDPLAQPGEQDITAHVDFTTLIEAGERCGWRTLAFTDQHHFIAGLIANNEATGRSYSPSELRQLKTLLHPEMLGTRFRVLAQARGLDADVRLDGMRLVG